MVEQFLFSIAGFGQSNMVDTLVSMLAESESIPKRDKGHLAYTQEVAKAGNAYPGADYYLRYYQDYGVRFSTIQDLTALVHRILDFYERAAVQRKLTEAINMSQSTDELMDSLSDITANRVLMADDLDDDGPVSYSDQLKTPFASGIMSGIPQIDELTNGFQRSTIATVAAFTGGGKCVDVDIRISTKEYGYITGRELLAKYKAGDDFTPVCGLSVEQTDGSYTPVSDLYLQRDVETLTLSLDGGQSFTGTPHHPIMVIRKSNHRYPICMETELVPMCEVKAGDLLVSRKPVSFDLATSSPSLLRHLFDCGASACIGGVGGWVSSDAFRSKSHALSFLAGYLSVSTLRSQVVKPVRYGFGCDVRVAGNSKFEDYVAGDVDVLCALFAMVDSKKRFCDLLEWLGIPYSVSPSGDSHGSLTISFTSTSLAPYMRMFRQLWDVIGVEDGDDARSIIDAFPHHPRYGLFSAPRLLSDLNVTIPPHEVVDGYNCVVVTEVSHGSGDVFDVTVPSTHLFMARNLVNHNTQCWISIIFKNALAGKKCVYLSLEMPVGMVWLMLQTRYLYEVKGIKFSSQDLIQRKLSEADQALVEKYDADFKRDIKANVLIKDSSVFPKSVAYSTDRICQLYSKFEKKLGGLDLVVFDHVNQLNNLFPDDGNKVIKIITDACVRWRSVGNEGMCTGFAAQCNREGRRRADRNKGDYDITAISDLNEIERASTVVMFLWMNDDMRMAQETVVSMKKHRLGALLTEPVTVPFLPSVSLVGSNVETVSGNLEDAMGSFAYSGDASGSGDGVEGVSQFM